MFYLDSDEVPELIIGYGDSHASRLYILTSDGENVYNLGKYGDTASIRYVPQKNLIYDYAGGQGYFRSAVLSIDDNGMVIKGAAISDAHTIESHYYIVDISGFKDTHLAVSGDMMLEGAVGNESSVMYSDVWNGTQTEVDEQEFNDAVKEYLEGNETEYIRYREILD